MEKIKGQFITLEGIEGVGKSTCIQFISDFLNTHDHPHIITREPGGTKFAEEIRGLLLAEHDEPIINESELLLMFAARAQNIQNCILPALLKGEWVVCDRFTDASFAYQGGGRGVDLEFIQSLKHWVQGELRPDLTFLLDAPVDIALERANKRGEPNRLEREKAEFYTRVRDAYLNSAKQEPDRFEVIDASTPVEQVQKQIEAVLNSRYG